VLSAELLAERELSREIQEFVKVRLAATNIRAFAFTRHAADDRDRKSAAAGIARAGLA